MKHKQQIELSRLKTAFLVGAAVAVGGLLIVAIGYAIHVFGLYEGGFRYKIPAVDSIEDAIMVELPFVVIGIVFGALAYFTYRPLRKKRK